MYTILDVAINNTGTTIDGIVSVNLSSDTILEPTFIRVGSFLLNKYIINDSIPFDSSLCKNCFSILPQQAVSIASSLIEFENTTIENNSNSNIFDYYYRINEGASTILLRNTSLNGVQASKYAIENINNIALTDPKTGLSVNNSMFSITNLQGDASIILPRSFNNGFYLKVTFTKGKDSRTQRYYFVYP